MTTALYRKEICYDRETHDFALYLDSELVGFSRTYPEAEATLDQLVFELISGEYFADQRKTADPIDATLDQPKLSLPVAPACVTLQGALPRAPHMTSVASIPSNSDGQDVATVLCPKCFQAIPARSQSGLCWCITWQQAGGAGECPDCQHYNHVIDCPGTQEAIQTPNLRTRLDYAISRARDTISPQDRREWTEEAFSLVERLVDADAVCDCGVAYNAGRCDECDENERIMSALRATAGGNVPGC